MKKILSLVLVTVLCVSTLVGCGSADTLKLIDTMHKVSAYTGVTETGTTEIEINKDELKKHIVVAVQTAAVNYCKDIPYDADTVKNTDVLVTKENVQHFVDVDAEVEKIMANIPEKIAVDYTVNWPDFEKFDMNFDLKIKYDELNLPIAGYIKHDRIAIELETLESLLAAAKQIEHESLKGLETEVAVMQDAIKSLREEGSTHVEFKNDFIDPAEFKEVIQQYKGEELKAKFEEEYAKIKSADASEIISTKNGKINLHGNGCSLAKLYSNVIKALKEYEDANNKLDEVLRNNYTVIDGKYVEEVEEGIIIDTHNGEVKLNTNLAVMRGEYENVKAGDRVIAIVSEASTMSIPPMTNAYLIYFGEGMFLTVVDVVEKVDADGGYKLVVADNKYNIIVNKETPVSNYKNKMFVTVDDIKAGDNLFVLYDNMTKSIPSQLFVKEIIIESNLENAYIIEEPCYPDILCDETGCNDCVTTDVYDAYEEMQFALNALATADVKKMQEALDIEAEYAKVYADALKNSIFDINVYEENNNLVTDSNVRVNVNNVDLVKLTSKEKISEYKKELDALAKEIKAVESEIVEARCAKLLAKIDKLERIDITWNSNIYVYSENGTYVRAPQPNESFECRIKTYHESDREFTYYGKAFLREDKIYLPMRQIIECSGLDVEWDGQNAYAIKADGTKIQMAGFIEDGRTYVKVRDFEQAGIKIDYIAGEMIDGKQTDNTATLEFN